MENYINRSNFSILAEMYGVVPPKKFSKEEKYNYVKCQLLERYPIVLKRKKNTPIPVIDFRKFNLDKYLIYTDLEIIKTYPIDSSSWWDCFESLMGHVTYGKIDNSKVEKIFKNISINLTGVRDGESILGIHNVTKGTVLKIKGNIPCYKKHLDILRLSPPIWSTFLEKIGSIDFFSKMTKLERANWLYYNQSSHEDISDIENYEFEVISLGNVPTKIGEENTKSLVEKEFWTPKEVLDFFPKKAGSKARKHSLFFISSFWKLNQEYEYQDKFHGICFNLEDGTVEFGAKNKEIIVIDDLYGFIIPKNRDTKIITIDDLFDLVCDILKIPISEIEEILPYFESFTPAGYKSLMQKIIRFRPLKVENHSSELFLLVTLSLLFIDKGSFVPDIQRFVSGAESFCKRLSVCIFEDSYLEDTNILSSLLMCAFLIQKVRHWKPSLEMIKIWFESAIKSLNDPRYWIYNLDETKGIELNKNTNTIQISAWLLSQIKSFKTDIYMIYNIRENNYATSKIKRPDNMPIYHCVDQHWLPEIVYYYGLLEEFDTASDFFKILWDQSGGVNTRKRQFVENETTSNIRIAQSKLLLSRKKERKIIISNTKLVKTIKNILSDSYIAGMVGGIEVKGNPKTISTLNPNNIQEIITIRKPSRDMKEAKVPDKRVVECESIIKKDLENIGLRMNKIPLPYPNNYKKILLFLVNNVNHVSIDNKNFTLEDFKQYSVKINIINKSIDPLTERSDCLVKGCIEKFDEYMKDQPKKVKDRLLGYFEKAEIVMPKISRDGSSNEIRYEDYKVFNILIEMCSLFPAAIELESGSKFKVKFLDFIKEILSKYKRLEKKFEKWPLIIPPNIKMWEHQQESLNEMLKRNSEGEKGHFIWIPVGLGKCLDPDTVILTSKGKRKVREIITGDYLIGDDFFYKKVKNTCEGYGKMFLVEQEGFISYKVNEEHILTLFNSHLNKIVDISLYEYLKETWFAKGKYYGINVSGNTYRINIRYFGYGPYYGFTLQGNGRFLLEDGTITHNTRIVGEFLYNLNKMGKLPNHVIYSCPDSAIDNTIKEAKSFNFQVEIMHPIKSAFKKGENMSVLKDVKINKTCIPSKMTITLIEHDHLRYCKDLSTFDSIFICDEVHKTLNDTQRTNSALQMAKSCRDFVALTGTPVIDNNIYKLINWLSLINDFEVNESNFWVSVLNMISKKVNTGVIVNREDVVFEMGKLYYDLVPPGLGGRNHFSTHEDLKKATELCYDISDKMIVERAIKDVKKGNRIFIVSKNLQHQEKLYQMFPNKKDIYLIKKGDSITLTEEYVEKGEMKAYNIIITTLKNSAGYTITYMNEMITGVYPSNNATREQLEGRINRIGQRSKEVKIITVHGGILSYILLNHKDAKSLSEVLKTLATDI